MSGCTSVQRPNLEVVLLLLLLLLFLLLLQWYLSEIICKRKYCHRLKLKTLEVVPLLPTDCFLSVLAMLSGSNRQKGSPVLSGKNLKPQCQRLLKVLQWQRFAYKDSRKAVVLI